MTRFHTSRILWMAVLAAAAGVPAAIAAAAPAAAAAATYTVTNMGSLGGTREDPVTDPSAINANGQVTGFSYTSATIKEPCPYPSTTQCSFQPQHASCTATAR